MKSTPPFDLPPAGPLRTEAAIRLLAAYLLNRGRYTQAHSLECELDEALAGIALYADEEKD